MHRFSVPIVLLLSFALAPTAALAQPEITAVLNGASFEERLAPSLIASAFGTDLSPTTEVSSDVPPPTQLAGVNVEILDSAGVSRFCFLQFVSPVQISFAIPPDVALGPATLRIRNEGAIVASTGIFINAVSPGLLTVSSGKGAPFGVVVTTSPDGSTKGRDTVRLTGNTWRSTEISLGEQDDKVVLLLVATGFRGFQSSIGADVGGIVVPASVGPLSGPLSNFRGLWANLVEVADEVRVGPLPRTLMNLGEVTLTVIVDGIPSNPVDLVFQEPPPPPPPPCSYAISETTISVPVEGGQFTFDITASRADCAWMANIFGRWITVNTVSGMGSESVTVNVAPNPGLERTGSISVKSRVLTVRQYGTDSVIPPTIAAAVSATFQPGPLSPGAIATLFGEMFTAGESASTDFGDEGTLPKIAAGASVEIEGVPAPLFFVNQNQINLQIPYETPTGAAVEFFMRRDGVDSGTETIEVMEAWPTAFRTGDGRAIIVDQDGSLGGPFGNGEAATIFVTGLGRLIPGVQTGRPAPGEPLSEASADINLRFAGVNADVLFVGATPFLVGLGQINFVVPAIPRGVVGSVEILVGRDITDSFFVDLEQ